MYYYILLYSLDALIYNMEICKEEYSYEITQKKKKIQISIIHTHLQVSSQ